jgi:hypothetical protein
MPGDGVAEPGRHVLRRRYGQPALDPDQAVLGQAAEQLDEQERLAVHAVQHPAQGRIWRGAEDVAGDLADGVLIEPGQVQRQGACRLQPRDRRQHRRTGIAGANGQQPQDAVRCRMPGKG